MLLDPIAFGMNRTGVFKNDTYLLDNFKWGFLGFLLLLVLTFQFGVQILGKGFYMGTTEVDFGFDQCYHFPCLQGKNSI